MKLLYNSYDLPQKWKKYEYVLSGYRMNYSIRCAFFSIFDHRHNEFWMIWSDICPCILYIIMFINWFFFHNPIEKINNHYISIAYIGIIISRICSVIYHVFNCISMDMNHKLIYIDYIGITHIILGAPWLYINTKNKNIYIYILVCIIGYIICITRYIYTLLYNKNNKYDQILLILLGFIGNYPSFIIILGKEYMIEWKINCGIGFFVFLFGFIFCYILKFPERFFIIGSSDGKFWHSHVIWHISISIAQYYFLKTTFLINHTINFI
tara:strand:+ start:15562 stop:16362 length:801 start_codon:yes stop_codon:yes gene_type:complete